MSLFFASATTIAVIAAILAGIVHRHEVRRNVLLGVSFTFAAIWMIPAWQAGINGSSGADDLARHDDGMIPIILVGGAIVVCVLTSYGLGFVLAMLRRPTVGACRQNYTPLP